MMITYDGLRVRIMAEDDWIIVLAYSGLYSIHISWKKDEYG